MSKINEILRLEQKGKLLLDKSGSDSVTSRIHTEEEKELFVRKRRSDLGQEDFEIKEVPDNFTITHRNVNDSHQYDNEEKRANLPVLNLNFNGKITIYIFVNFQENQEPKRKDVPKFE